MDTRTQGEIFLIQGKKVDKRSRLPAYVQLADMLRNSISKGAYPPGGRLPSESALAKANGVSAMTARQAMGVLMEEGLVRRIQGKGTFVRKIGFSASSFELTALNEVFSDKQNLSVQIVTTTVQKPTGEIRNRLALDKDQSVILVERVILHHNEPYAFHVSYTRFDPKSPTVESMLDTVVLTEFVFHEGYSNFKRGFLGLIPVQLTEREAQLLHLEAGQSVFRLEHLFYNFDGLPAAFGWFIVSHEKMPLGSRVGIWDE